MSTKLFFSHLFRPISSFPFPSLSFLSISFPRHEVVPQIMDCSNPAKGFVGLGALLAPPPAEKTDILLHQQTRSLGPDFQKILGQTYEKLRIRSDLGKS